MNTRMGKDDTVYKCNCAENLGYARSNTEIQNTALETQHHVTTRQASIQFVIY